MKNKELEEQVEMRRLRTENTLLRQRISGLELENGNLADKLIQVNISNFLHLMLTIVIVFYHAIHGLGVLICLILT